MVFFRFLFLGLASAGAVTLVWFITSITPTSGQPEQNQVIRAGMNTDHEPESKNDQGETTIGIPVLCYHGNFSSQQTKSPYNVPPNQLEEQMKFLSEQGYETISLQTFYRAMKGEAVVLPPKPILITFDDGKKTNLTVAKPILEKYGFKAVLFIYPTFIISKKHKNLKLTWDELRYLDKAGFEVQSHTYWHPKLFTMSRSEQVTQFKKSRSRLEKELDKRVAFLAYPFGGYNLVSIAELKRNGYRAAFTINAGINYPGKTALFELKRYMVTRNLSMKTFRHFVESPTPTEFRIHPEPAEWVTPGEQVALQAAFFETKPDKVIMRMSGKKITMNRVRGVWQTKMPAFSAKAALINAQFDFYRQDEWLGYEQIIYNRAGLKQKSL